VKKEALEQAFFRIGVSYGKRSGHVKFLEAVFKKIDPSS